MVHVHYPSLGQTAAALLSQGAVYVLGPCGRLFEKWKEAVTDLVVRSSTPDDLNRIVNIYSHYVLHTSASFEIDPPDLEEMAKRRCNVLTGGLPYLVAEEGNRVVGYAYAHSYRPRAAYRFTIEDSIYVDPEQTGKGCGRALLTALIRECERGRWRQMISVIGGSDNLASIGLHRSCGFRDVGTLISAGFKFDRWVDSVLMQRELVGKF